HVDSQLDLDKEGGCVSGYGAEYCVFFFFQAEDGIRDWSVTGVQTCALPICPSVANGRVYVMDRVADPVKGNPAQTVSSTGKERRSEERRVGKECRSRWAP